METHLEQDGMIRIGVEIRILTKFGKRGYHDQRDLTLKSNKYNCELDQFQKK
jgi:hypothetical protein